MIACDQSLHDLHALFSGGGVWVNPQAALIGDTTTAATAGILSIDAAILALDPEDEDYAEKLEAMTELRAVVVSLSGDPLDVGTMFTAPLAQSLAYSDFLSGQSQVFPAAQLGSLTTGIPNAQYLASLGFVSMLGIVSAAPNMEKELCTFDVDNPCASLNGVFDFVLGSLNSGFNTILTLLGTLSGIAGMALEAIAEAIAAIAQFVTDLIDTLVEGLTKLAEMVGKAIIYGMTKLFQALRLDPCAAGILASITNPGLHGALGLAP